MPGLDWQLLPNDLQELVKKHLLGAHLRLRWAEGQNETNQTKYLSIREWNRRNKEEQKALPEEEREVKMHPTCAARMVCKAFSEQLKFIPQSEVRVNREFCMKNKKRFKSEELALTAIFNLLMYVTTGLSDGYFTKTQRERCKMHLITAWTARVADAVTKRNDPTAKFAYSALKGKLEKCLGDSRPGTGAFRRPEVRQKIAQVLKVLAVPVDELGNNAYLRPAQRRRRQIDNQVSIALLYA